MACEGASDDVRASEGDDVMGMELTWSVQMLPRVPTLSVCAGQLAGEGLVGIALCRVSELDDLMERLVVCCARIE